MRTGGGTMKTTTTTASTTNTPPVSDGNSSQESILQYRNGGLNGGINKRTDFEVTYDQSGQSGVA